MAMLGCNFEKFSLEYEQHQHEQVKGTALAPWLLLLKHVAGAQH
jgi:hypothetical protein